MTGLSALWLPILLSAVFVFVALVLGLILLYWYFRPTFECDPA